MVFDIEEYINLIKKYNYPVDIIQELQQKYLNGFL